MDAYEFQKQYEYGLEPDEEVSDSELREAYFSYQAEQEMYQDWCARH